MRRGEGGYNCALNPRSLFCCLRPPEEGKDLGSLSTDAHPVLEYSRCSIKHSSHHRSLPRRTGLEGIVGVETMQRKKT